MTPQEKMTFDYLNNPNPSTPAELKRDSVQSWFDSRLLSKLFSIFDHE